MIDKTTNSIDIKLHYRSPEVRVVFVKAQGLLCQSSNEPMREYDYGDGGFGEA